MFSHLWNVRHYYGFFEKTSAGVLSWDVCGPADSRSPTHANRGQQADKKRTIISDSVAYTSIYVPTLNQQRHQAEAPQLFHHSPPTLKKFSYTCKATYIKYISIYISVDNDGWGRSVRAHVGSHLRHNRYQDIYRVSLTGQRRSYYNHMTYDIT